MARARRAAHRLRAGALVAGRRRRHRRRQRRGGRHGGLLHAVRALLVQRLRADVDHAGAAPGDQRPPADHPRHRDRPWPAHRRSDRPRRLARHRLVARTPRPRPSRRHHPLPPPRRPLTPEPFPHPPRRVAVPDHAPDPRVRTASHGEARPVTSARGRRRAGDARGQLAGPIGGGATDMWNTFGTEGPLGITTEIVTIDGGGGDEIHAYAARPRGDGSRGGIVAVHHLPGWDEYYFEFSERLARHGFDVICPDLYCRFGHGTPDDVAATVRSQGGVADESVVGDCRAALAWLKGLPTANGNVGVIGSCSGGRHAVLAASLVPEFAAVVDLWGGGVVMPSDQLTPARPV